LKEHRLSAPEIFSFEIHGKPVEIAYLPRNGFIVREVFQDQCYAPVEFVQGVTDILDIGANIGASTIFFHFVYPQAQIHAFEPGHGAYELLVQNARPYPQIQAHNVGLWSEDKTAELFVGDHDYATASIADTATDNRTTDRIELKACAAYLKSQGISKVDVAKIDTEGCEIPIIEDLIANYAMRVIYLEFHSEEDRWQLDEMLRQDYSLFSANIHQLHRGTVCYVCRQIIADDSDFDQHRISVAR